jgi:DNA-binding CsgD family transcriptional regulator
MDEQQLIAETYGSAVGELLLARSRRPSVLLKADAAIVFANAAARRLLEAGTVLAWRAGRLAAAHGESDARLRRALQALDADGAPERLFLGLREAAGGRVVPACLWALRRRAAAAGLLTLATAAAPDDHDCAVLGTLFGLTPAEARVASLLVGDQPPKGIAAALGLSVATVRHHIRRLLHKTGARDLRDLTRQIILALQLGSL